MSKNELEIKEFEYYIVFQDSNSNYVIAYGYKQLPAVIDIKYAFDQVSKEPDLVSVIPEWQKQVDYVSVDIMNHKSFIKYMIKQEEKAAKAEKKAEKKAKKKEK